MTLANSSKVESEFESLKYLQSSGGLWGGSNKTAQAFPSMLASIVQSDLGFPQRADHNQQHSGPGLLEQPDICNFEE